MIIYLLVVLCLLPMFVWGEGHPTKIDMKKVVEKAEQDINEELMELMKSGAKSRRFSHKKITPV